MQRTDRLPGGTGSGPTRKCSEHLRWERSSCGANFKLRKPRLHSGAACDTPGTTEIPKVPPIPEIVWQQPSETSTNQSNLNIINNDLTIQYTQETSKRTVASQTSPPKGTQLQNYVDATEHPPGNQTGNEPVPFLICSKNCPTDTQNSEKHITVHLLEVQQFHPSPPQPH